MKEIISRIAGLLLHKNIPFCIYRFPDQDTVHLAVDSDRLPHEPELSFIMAPFSTCSKASEILMHVVKDEFINQEFYNQVALSPVFPEVVSELPPETLKEDYFNRLNFFIEELRKGTLDKAILSRVFYEPKPDDFDPVRCFFQLENDYPHTFTHLSLHPQSGIWIGATPELLLRKRGSEISTMALAGTQARKESGDYNWRDKEMKEHEMVGWHIEETFHQFGLSLIRKEGPKTVESGRVAHLRTDYVFREEDPVFIKNLLSELHPTPAVGGLPVNVGERFILKNEGYDRKYYCGYIGQTDSNETADLFINLRCMQIGEKNIAIFVGGGITAESDPQEEWQETVLKSKTMAEKINPVKELHHHEVIK